MSVRQLKASHMKESALRKRLTQINKVKAWAKAHPTGLTDLMLEAMEDEERIIRGALKARFS